jgi:hypothetical protein
MTNFEKKLRLLFDAQDFFREPLLDTVMERETVKALSDNELEFLFAAGDPFAAKEKKDDDTT